MCVWRRSGAWLRVADDHRGSLRREGVCVCVCERHITRGSVTEVCWWRWVEHVCLHACSRSNTFCLPGMSVLE